MLHHSQSAFYGRALLPTPQENLLFVEQASCLSQAAFYGRALLPTPQENLLFVEQASCLFLRMVQDVSFNGIEL